MRLRTVKPGFFKNETLAEVPPLGRILFAGLWCMADREGRLEDRPKRIKAEILPYDDCDIDALLNELAQRHFILRYEADGDRFVWIVKFKSHQFPNKREAASILPAPSEAQSLTVLSPSFHSERPSPAHAFHSGISVTPLLRSSVNPLVPPMVPLSQGDSPHANQVTNVSEATRENQEPTTPDGNSQSKKPKAGANHLPRRAASPPPPSLTTEQNDKLVAKWSPVLPDVRERIDAALNHVASRKAIKLDRYVDNWLRNDASKVPASALSYANGHGPPSKSGWRPWGPPDIQMSEAQKESRRQQDEFEREEQRLWAEELARRQREGEARIAAARNRPGAVASQPPGPA